MLKEVEEKKTPLQEKIEASSKKLGMVILLLSALIALSGILRGYPAYEMFIWGVALAVALIPEALPAVSTITLALGVKRMAEKRLSSENFLLLKPLVLLPISARIKQELLPKTK